MDFLPAVVRAEYRGEYSIHITFNDGSAKTIDFRGVASCYFGCGIRESMT